MNVIGLFRVSTERQASEGASLEAQERNFHELAAKNGWTTVATFRGCESATQASSDRKVLTQVLECVRSNKVDAIWVIEQSRLTRGDTLDVATLMRELQDQKTKVIVGSTVRDLASIDDNLMFGIQSVIDRAESARIKERMGRGKKERARQGKRVCGAAPYGYRNPHHGENGRGTLQIIESEATVVRKIFTMRVAGHGERGIAAELNRLGTPAPRGQRWGKSTISRILRCPAYIGTAASNVWIDKDKRRSFRMDLTNPKAIIVAGAHEPIIDRATWDAVKAMAPLPRTATPRLLTGLLTVDGMAYGADASKGVSFYRSPRGVRGAAWLETEGADQVVWDAFTKLATGKAFVEKLIAEAQNPRQQEISRAEVDYLKSEIVKRERRLENLVDMREGEEITKDQFRQRSHTCRTELEALRKTLAEEQSKSVVLDGTHAARIVKAVQSLIAGRTRLTVEQKRSILGSIVTKIDATVAPTGALQPRAPDGRVLGKGGPRWRIERVAFRLALPGEQRGTGERGGNGANARSGGLAQSAAGSDQLAGAEGMKIGEVRFGQLAPSSCSCALPPPRQPGRV